MSAAEAPDTLRVLLVEDDEDDAAMTRALLSNIPGTRFEMDWVSSYDRGLEMIQANRHDVDLVDYHLGMHSGLDLLHAIQGETRHAPVIMLTGHGNESVVLEAMRSGAADYLPKGSMSSESLERAISHAVEKFRLRCHLDERHRELQQANDDLKMRSEEIERFYHVLAHELKTPLTAASEFVDILLEEISGPINADQREYLQIIDGCFDSLKQNINDLFDITRLETGKLSVTLESAPVDDLIHQVVTSFGPIAHHKGVTLDCAVSPNLSAVFMDPQRIRQVLNNLLSNAIKFTPSGGFVTIAASEETANPSFLTITVTDTGQGIEADQLSRIFGRLYQIRDDSSPSVAGLGLGLFIARELVKLHGGTLSVTSTPGVGSTFSFTLRHTSQPTS
ncbi:MAG: hybrid sensor histidine kinase/response regulator [Nitrospirales bacterium]|nr:hybrid sensor histidine kinase/response regulator [Nitrospira sp.]MDR4503080.1 hybrid sensor histidine kinase/response regulator [Nitrospirales bacterium]